MDEFLNIRDLYIFTRTPGVGRLEPPFLTLILTSGSHLRFFRFSSLDNLVMLIVSGQSNQTCELILLDPSSLV